jgi:c-di-GMP-related signal transduction protein
MTLFPKDRVVVEILETVRPDQMLIEACVRLKAAGYRMALDDFSTADPRRVLVPMADMLKVDWIATTPAQRRELIQESRRPNLFFLQRKLKRSRNSS